MKLMMGIVLKCCKCGIVTMSEWGDIDVSISDYDKRWGLDVYEKCCAYVKGHENQGWYEDEDDALCPGCAKSIKAEIRKEQLQEAKIKRKEDARQKVVDIKKQLAADPRLAKMLKLAIPIEEINVDDIEDDEIDDPYDIEDTVEYQEKRAEEEDYFNKWINASKEDKDAMELQSAVSDIKDILENYPQIRDMDEIKKLFIERESVKL